MGFFDEPMRLETADARRALPQLLRNHPGHEIPIELKEVADRYLRLNPDDTEVRSARDLLTVPLPGRVIPDAGGRPPSTGRPEIV